tara:strand:- start:166 stop:366 length:201 start_codon:yes stop_codon:yes gene_type:complete
MIKRRIPGRTERVGIYSGKRGLVPGAKPVRRGAPPKTDIPSPAFRRISLFLNVGLFTDLPQRGCPI